MQTMVENEIVSLPSVASMHLPNLSSLPSRRIRAAGTKEHHPLQVPIQIAHYLYLLIYPIPLYLEKILEVPTQKHFESVFARREQWSMTIDHRHLLNVNYARTTKKWFHQDVIQKKPNVSI